ncbi:DinB family protein [uncultured Friedmanniella sp.]|uniref:DinB family protein n=1 Tax=uncultured Friedmanniella sp. TaxID=335381 RepID=UPI0035CB14FC
MPGTAPPAATEAETLLGFLRQQRDGLLYAGYGLTPDQLRATPTASTLSVGGLVQHGILTEAQWVDVIAGRSTEGSQDDYAAGFRLGATGSYETLRARQAEQAAATDELVRSLPDLGAAVTLPEAPWMPKGPGYTVRWVLVHIIEELSRHAGHADIIREHIDGATMYALMAAAEGWPETPWMKPWRPAAT